MNSQAKANMKASSYLSPRQKREAAEKAAAELQEKRYQMREFHLIRAKQAQEALKKPALLAPFVSRPPKSPVISSSRAYMSSADLTALVSTHRFDNFGRDAASISRFKLELGSAMTNTLVCRAPMAHTECSVPTAHA